MNTNAISNAAAASVSNGIANRIPANQILAMQSSELVSDYRKEINNTVQETRSSYNTTNNNTDNSYSDRYTDNSFNVGRDNNAYEVEVSDSYNITKTLEYYADMSNTTNYNISDSYNTSNNYSININIENITEGQNNDNSSVNNDNGDAANNNNVSNSNTNSSDNINHNNHGAGSDNISRTNCRINRNNCMRAYGFSRYNKFSNNKGMNVYILNNNNNNSFNSIFGGMRWGHGYSSRFIENILKQFVFNSFMQIFNHR